MTYKVKRIKGHIGIIKHIIYTILLFLIIYQFSLTFIGLPPSVHSTRIGAIGIVILGVIMRRKNNIRLFSRIGFFIYFKLCIFLFFYGLLLVLVAGRGDGIHLTDVVMNNLIITIPVIWGLSQIFDNLDSFLEILVYVGIVQSIFIILCFINEPLQLMIDNAVNNVDSDTHNILILRNGYAGGIGCITSSGTTRFTTGLLATSYLYVKRQKTIYIVIFTVFAVLNSMISRTGLIMDIFCFLYIFFQMGSKNKSLKYFISLFVIIGIIYLLISSGQYDSFLDDRYHRFRDLKESGVDEGFFNGYFGGHIPNIQDNTLMGTGILSGIAANGTIVNIDGGPLRIYSATGLICAIIIYLILFKIMKINIRIQSIRMDKYFMFLLMIYLIVADLKDITFFIAWPLAIFFTISLLIQKYK